MRYLIMAAFFALALLASSAAYAASAKIAWEYDNEGQAGFKIYFGKTSQVSVTAPKTPDTADPAPYTTQVTINNPDAREAVVTIPNGTTFFRVTAFGPGAESEFSNEAMAKIAHSKPGNNRVVQITVKP